MPESDKYQSFYTVGHVILSVISTVSSVSEIKKTQFFLDREVFLLNIWHNT